MGTALWRTVYDELESDISLRRVPPGTRLAEIPTAKALGVSRNPVREAFRVLEREGWVELRPKLGAFVREPSDKEAAELFQVRDLLETEAARLACKHITAEELLSLEGLLDRGFQAVAAKDVDLLAQLNTAFHDKVVEAAHQTVLEQLLNGLRRKVTWYFIAVAVDRGPQSWEEHKMIVEAFQRRDEGRTVELIRHHWRQTAALYFSLASPDRFTPHAE